VDTMNYWYLMAPTVEAKARMQSLNRYWRLVSSYLKATSNTPIRSRSNFISLTGSRILASGVTAFTFFATP
jgi:hypothetical protein